MVQLRPTSESKKTYGSQTYTVDYTYDPQGRMKTMITSGQAGASTTTWNYNSLRGWLDDKRYNDNRGTNYTYTPAGRMATRTWARGIVTTYGYTPAGDLAGADYSDAVTPDVTYSYDRQGRRSQVIDGSGTRLLQYNAAGQSTLESYTAGLMSGLSLTQGYDSLLRRDSLTLKDGATVLQSQSFGYADASRLDTVTEGNDEVSYGYLTNSPQVETVTFKRSGSTVMTTTKTHDFVNRLTDIASVTAGGTVSSHTYDHTPLNQRNRADLADGTHWVYQYNSKGEVTNGTRYDASNNALSGQNYGYTYDGIGNRLTRLIDGGVASSYTSNKLNQYTAITGTGAASPTYDFDGNLTNNGTNIFEYDGENRLRVVKRSSGSVLVATYTYDDQSRRIRTVTTASAPQGVKDIVYAWHGWNLVGELANASGTFFPVRYHSWGQDLGGSEQDAGGIGGLLMQKDAFSGEVYYPSYDGNGNLMNLVQASDASVAASYIYDAFGRTVASSGAYANENPFRFSTKYSAPESELYYYGYRFYDPIFGRWSSRDPVGEEGGENLYSLIRNDAISSVDYLGLSAVEDLIINNIGADVSLPVLGPLGIPIGPTGFRFQIRFFLSGNAFECCDEGTVKKYGKGTAGVEAYVVWGKSFLKSGQGKGRDRNKPHPDGGKNKDHWNKDTPPDSGFRSRSWHVDHVFPMPRCPKKGMDLSGSGSIFLRGSAGIGFAGVQFNIVKTILPKTNLTEGWSVTGSVSGGVVGATVEGGGGAQFDFTYGPLFQN